MYDYTIVNGLVRLYRRVVLIDASLESPKCKCKSTLVEIVKESKKVSSEMKQRKYCKTLSDGNSVHIGSFSIETSTI